MGCVLLCGSKLAGILHLPVDPHQERYDLFAQFAGRRVNIQPRPEPESGIQRLRVGVQERHCFMGDEGTQVKGCERGSGICFHVLFPSFCILFWGGAETQWHTFAGKAIQQSQ